MKYIVRCSLIAIFLLGSTLGSKHALNSTISHYTTVRLVTPMAQPTTIQSIQYNTENNSINNTERSVMENITFTLPPNLPSSNIILTTKVQSPASSSAIYNNLQTSKISVIEVATEPSSVTFPTGNEATSKYESSTKINALDNTSSSITTPNGQIPNESSPGIVESSTSEPISGSSSTLSKQSMVTSTPKTSSVSIMSERYQESITISPSITFVPTESGDAPVEESKSDVSTFAVPQFTSTEYAAKLEEKITTELNPSRLNSKTATPETKLVTTLSANGQSDLSNGLSASQLDISTPATSEIIATKLSAENAAVTEVSTEKGYALENESTLKITTQNLDIATRIEERDSTTFATIKPSVTEFPVKPVENVTPDLSAGNPNSRSIGTTLEANTDTSHSAEGEIRSSTAISPTRLYISTPAVSELITRQASENIENPTSPPKGVGDALAEESKLRPSTQNLEPVEHLTTEFTANSVNSRTFGITLRTNMYTTRSTGGETQSTNDMYTTPVVTEFITREAPKEIVNPTWPPTEQIDALADESSSTQNSESVDNMPTESTSDIVNSRTMGTTLGKNMDSTRLAEGDIGSTNALTTSELYISTPAASEFITKASTENVVRTSVLTDQGDALADESKLTIYTRVTTTYPIEPVESVTTDSNSVKSTSFGSTLETKMVTSSSMEAQKESNNESSSQLRSSTLPISESIATETTRENVEVTPSNNAFTSSQRIPSTEKLLEISTPNNIVSTTEATEHISISVGTSSQSWTKATSLGLLHSSAIPITTSNGGELPLELTTSETARSAENLASYISVVTTQQPIGSVSSGSSEYQAAGTSRTANVQTLENTRAPTSVFVTTPPAVRFTESVSTTQPPRKDHGRRNWSNRIQ